MKLRTIPLVFLLTFPTFIGAQDAKRNGKVTNTDDGSPLAFVNIRYDRGMLGTTSNIDGWFQFPENTKMLILSYIGYETDTVQIVGDATSILEVQLRKSAYHLDEVTILPGVNPAHRIINQVIANRDLNNPEKMTSFSYTSYNKMSFSIDYPKSGKEEPVKNKSSGKSDSTSFLKLKHFFDEQHLMLMESVSHRKFIAPDNNLENVTASRVSGFSDPSFSLLATQLQSFAFYDELITIYEKQYLNPISDGATRKYFFLIEDTLYTETHDTLFIISYCPRKGKNFEGLTGIFHINSNGYAIQSVIAEPSSPQNVTVKVQQNYAFLENKQWFPIQLNTDVYYNNLKTGSGVTGSGKSSSGKSRIVGTGKSYLEDIVLYPELSKKEFSSVELIVDDNAYNQSEDFWNSYRAEPLTEKDKKTYHVIDSIGKEEKLDLKLKALGVLFTGKLSWKFLNLPLDEFMNYNEYEGFRLGVGAETNEKIARWFSIGGYYAYGFRDRKHKYGGKLKFNFHKKSELSLVSSYHVDVSETGGMSFLDDNSLLTSELFREFMVMNMDRETSSKVGVSFRTLDYLKVNLFGAYSEVQSTSGYLFGTNSGPVAHLTDRFVFAEIGVNIRYAFKEKFIQTTWGSYSVGTDYPIVWINVRKGFPTYGGEYNFYRLEGKISKQFISKSIGSTHVQILGGLVEGEVPLSRLFVGRGSYMLVTVEAENSFNTMRMGEFFSDRFVYAFVKQDFGKLLFKTEKFQPELALSCHFGIGQLSNKQHHYNYPIRTMEKGYYETGILFNNLIGKSSVGYGLAVFYRYGPYAFAGQKDNFAYKLTFTVKL